MMNNLKPSVLPSISEMHRNLKVFGFTEDDLVTLIQRRTKLNRADIEVTLKVIEKIENRIIKAEEIRRALLFNDLVMLSQDPQYKKEMKRILIG